MGMRIRGGRVIDPATERDEIADVVIEDGRILNIGCKEERTAAAGETVIDAQGLIVAPGLIDVHVHFRDPGQIHKEDLLTGAAAAARGGFTTVICMANTKPPVDDSKMVRDILARGKRARIHILQAATITRGMLGEELTDFAALKAAGAAGLTDDGLPILDSKLALEAMKRARELELVLSFHEEDPRLIEKAGVHRGTVSERLGFPGASRAAEDVMVARDCMLALESGARISIQHISSGNSVEMIRMVRRMGADVWAEVSPHHFSLTEDAVLQHGAYAKMNPPLRTEWDREEIIRGMQDGTVSIIATDHAPHSREEKDQGLMDAPSGIIGLETALALGVTNLVDSGRLTMMKLLEKMTINPAELYGLNAGVIEAGGAADLVVFDPKERWTVGEFASKSSNSPFAGETLMGKVKYTICSGNVVFQDC